MTATSAPIAWIGMSGSAIPSVFMTTGTAAIRMPMTTSATETAERGRHVGSGATSNWTATSPESAARSSRIRPSSVRSRSTGGRRIGSGFGDGRLGERPQLATDLDGLPVSVVLLGRRLPLGDEALRLARLLERTAPLAERPFGLGPALAGGRQRVPIALELGQRELALLDGPPGLDHRHLGDLEASRVAVARVLSSWRARSSFRRARLVPRSAPLIEACSRSRRAPSSRERSLSSKWWTEAVERKKPSVGMPVSSAITWSASVGS
jgi:hypothetical protein